MTQPGKQDFKAAQRLYISERRAKVIALYKLKKTQNQIAKELGMSRALVEQDIAAMIAEWKRATSADMAFHIANELEAINHREQIAWAAYEKSCQNKTVASVINHNGDVATRGTSIERQEGDPRFLLVTARCTDQRVKLLGMTVQSKGADGATREFTFADAITAYYRSREKPVTEIGPKRLGSGKPE